MPKVEFKRVETDEEVENINIKDGQLIYSKTGKTFMDYGNERIPTGSGGSSVDVDTEMSDTSENAVQNKVIKEYVDDQIEIGDTEPTSEDNKIWIDTGEVGSAVSEITNEYSTSTGKGYSANYVNNLIKFEKIGNDLTGTGTLNLSKPITDYTFILVITFGGTHSAKTSVLIPTELAITYNASDDFSGSAIQSTSVFYQTEFYFSNSTTINITGATHSGWPNTGIKAVYGIKI